MPNILYVEDDATVRENYSLFLTKAGFTVTAVESTAAALQYFEKSKIDLALLDIGLGDDTDAGFHLCTELRKRSETLPIIFLTLLDSDFDKISGMRLGADDYITKNISIEYLIVRIKALLNRINRLKSPDSPANRELIRGDLSIDMDRLKAAWKGKPINLNLTQIWMVYDLAKNRGGARTPEQIMEAANLTIQINTLVVHIKNIRDVFLTVDPDFSAIKTERGIGYRWVDEE